MREKIKSIDKTIIAAFFYHKHSTIKHVLIFVTESIFFFNNRCKNLKTIHAGKATAHKVF